MGAMPKARHSIPNPIHDLWNARRAFVEHESLPESVSYGAVIGDRNWDTYPARPPKAGSVLVIFLRLNFRAPRIWNNACELTARNMRPFVDQAAAVVKEAEQAQQEALDSEKKAEKGTAKLEKRRSEQDNRPRAALASAKGRMRRRKRRPRTWPERSTASCPRTRNRRTCCTR